MSEFSCVEFKQYCPQCGEIVSDFQTKDKFVSGRYVLPEEINHFYSFCHNCRFWIEYERENEVGEDGKNYELFHSENDENDLGLPKIRYKK